MMYSIYKVVQTNNLGYESDLNWHCFVLCENDVMLKYFCVYNGNLTTAISSIVNMDIQKYYNYNAIYNLASYELKKILRHLLNMKL